MRQASNTTEVLEIVGGLTLAIVAFVLFLVIVFSLAGRKEYEGTDEWDEFNREVVGRFFNIPEEAEIVDASRQIGLMKDDWIVKFRLPDTRNPDEWMQIIVAGKPIEDYKVNEFLYEAGDWYDAIRTGKDGEWDGYRLTFIEADRLYVAEYHWD